jgi:hypothetical protein
LNSCRKHFRRLSFNQAEKSTIALHRHHEELKDVWGDLEKSIPIVVPQKAEQPANLKVTLLPFQQESLYWMRKQERGVWHGGMLAVCFVLLLYNIVLTLHFGMVLNRTKWGKQLFCNGHIDQLIIWVVGWAKRFRSYRSWSQIPINPTLSSRKFSTLTRQREFSYTLSVPPLLLCNGGTKSRLTPKA